MKAAFLLFGLTSGSENHWLWQDYKVVHSHRSTGRIGVAVVE